MQPGCAVRWARTAMAGVLLYVVIDIVLVFLRPQFSVLHNAESDYGSRGSWAWLMDLNFLLRCAISLAVIWVLLRASRRSARLLVGLGLLTLWAVASALLAAFPDDPSGTPAHWTGKVHLTLAFLAFLAALVGAILVTRALWTQSMWRPWRSPMAVLAVGALVPMVLLGRAGFRPHSLGGLYEKVFLAMILAWLLLAVVPVGAGRRRAVTGTPAPPAPVAPGTAPR